MNGIKRFQENGSCILTIITKKNRSTKFRIDKETEFAGEFEKLWKAEGIQLYSTMSGSKAAFAQRTV